MLLYRRPWLSAIKFSVSWRSAVQLLRVRDVVCRCIVLLEHSRCQTLRIAGSCMTSLLRHHDVEKTLKKSVRDITSISCFVTTMKLLHALQIYSTVFVCEEVYAVAFFKVVQEQTTMCSKKKHVTTFFMISWSRTVRLERFLAYLLLRVLAIDRCFYFPTSRISCSYVTLGNCQDLNISKN